MDELTDEKKESRRELLKKVGKTAAFVVPTIFTFEVSNMAQTASGFRKRSHLSDAYRGDPKGHF